MKAQVKLKLKLYVIELNMEKELIHRSLFWGTSIFGNRELKVSNHEYEDSEGVIGK